MTFLVLKNNVIFLLLNRKTLNIVNYLSNLLIRNTVFKSTLQ